MKFSLRTLMLAAIVCGIALSLLLCLDSGMRRKRTAYKIQQLKSKFLENGDSLALKQIGSHIKGSYVFGQVYACGTVKELGPKAAPLVDGLIEAASSSNMTVQQEAIRALGALESEGSKAMPLLRRRLVERSFLAADAVGQIGTADLITRRILEEGAVSGNELFRKACAVALEKLDAANRLGAKKSADQIKQ